MIKSGFFAYTTSVSSSTECIRDAIKQINAGKSCQIQSWEELSVAGRLVITPILEAIEKADFFCADLTGMNDNVLFEIGYAIAKGKPIWLVLDTSKEKWELKFKELGFMTIVGYSAFHNTQDLLNSFYSSSIYDQSETLLDDLTKQMSIAAEDKKATLFLKSQIDTNYGQQIATDLENYRLPYFLDDANENKTQPLLWYFEKLNTSASVLAEFSSTERAGYELQNSKCALISGLALGFGKRLLMLAEAPYEVPLDYRGLLIPFSNRDQLNEAIIPFLTKLKDEIAELLTVQKEIAVHQEKRSELHNFNIGECIAEHETEGIPKYFVETADFKNILRSEYNIVVGRKGTGKTATLYYTFNKLSNRRHKLICLIKPVNFEVEGLVDLLQSQGDFEKGYLIESIWKFLIYTEIAKELYKNIQEKADYLYNEKDQNFCKYIEANRDIFLSDFSTRLQEQIKELKEMQTQTETELSQRDFRINVSEILHSGLIGTLKKWFSTVIDDHQEIIVLIDNLDKSWKKNANFTIISQYLLGLLGVAGRITKELSNIKLNKSKLSFQLILFLRSDIFKYILKQAREPDKIEITRLKWDDSEILLRLIEERYEALSPNPVLGSQVWEKFFPEEVNGIGIKEYLFSCIFPRPRDLLYLMKQCKDYAISRGHDRIYEIDIESGYSDYSRWIFTSILVENGITMSQMENFMTLLMGESSILEIDHLKEIAIQVDVKFKDDKNFEYLIDHLVSLCVFGREVKPNEFRFDFEAQDEEKFKAMSKKNNSNRLKIHKALHCFLECQ